MAEQAFHACPICQGAARFLADVDANKTCEDRHGQRLLEVSAKKVAYYVCGGCGYCYAPDFAHWHDEDFLREIYNEDYAHVDPDCVEARPAANARMLLNAFALPKNVLHLDYGGGDGRLSALLADAGWQTTSMDPYRSVEDDGTVAASRQFGLVSAFEVFEHVPDPHALIKTLQSFLATPGLLLFSTLLSDGQLALGQPLDWWYAAPRNGHISLFSKRSLAELARCHGMNFASLNANVHVMWASLPGWAAHLLNRGEKAMPKQPVDEAGLKARVQANPNDHEGWHQLGIQYFAAGNLAMAVQMLEAALAVSPKVALYQRNLGEMYRRLGRYDKAVTAGRAAIRLAKNDLDAHYNLGLAYTDARDYDKAVRSYKKAIALNPRHNLSWNNLGSALEQQGFKSAALHAYEQAIIIDAKHAEAQNNAGAIYSEQGRLDEARASFEQAISARPDFVEAHYNLSSLKKYTPDDPHLAVLQRLYASRSALAIEAQIRYGFAFGKALDDVGQFDRAFAAYAEANRLQHQRLPFNEADADLLVSKIIRVFNPGFLAARRKQVVVGDEQRTPVFIVGMPRSGTTLLEQILCSHSAVYGAGELRDLNASAVEVMNAGSGQFDPGQFVHLSDADIKKIGDDYLERVWQLSPESLFITDKMPANFFYLGLIHLALPNARIIHAMRDPMDSCFSCYSRLFNETMEFAYDLGTLGRYYQRYMALMAHWKHVLPPGTILDLPYEALVEDTEGQARRILEFVGLPWDDRCLEFYKNERLVKTASVAQVRKPIYKNSVARWRHFAKHLKPLYELVKAYREADDAAILIDAQAAETESRTAAETAHLKGMALYRQGSFDEALRYYNEALALQPDFPAALNSKGFVLQDQNRMDEALACFEQAVVMAPGFSIARLNLALAQLKMGDWHNGWRNYEARWTGSAEANNGTLLTPVCPLPRWQGETDVSGKSLLVTTEQGFGDTFQFSRYLPLVARKFKRVGFACSEPTRRVIEWTYGYGETPIVTLTRMPSDYAAWDLYCPLMSLPLAFGTTPQSIPADMPTLQVTSAAGAYWRDRLNTVAHRGLRVGIAWAGREAHQYDARRSLRLEQLGALLDNQCVTWVSLQKWQPGAIRPSIPNTVHWVDWTDELTDFADTAALISNLDLVITIDSAIVHLAGSLNKPVWLLNRFDNEWRWFQNWDQSPWYPSLRIFNQPEFGDWASPIRDVIAALGQWTKEIVHHSAEATAHAAPTPAEVAHHQGIGAWNRGDREAALALLAQAVATDGRRALYCSNLAEMNRQSGNLDAAILYAEKAVAIDPAMPGGWSNLGIAYFDKGRLDDAEESHQRALALAPDVVHSLNNLGSIARVRKDLRSAANWYRKALDVKTDFVESLSNLGAVLTEDDQYEAAEPVLLRALALSPDYPEALCNLGLVRLKQGRFSEGQALFVKCLAHRKNHFPALIGSGRACHEMEQPELAKQLFQEASQVAPDDPEPWCRLGAVLMENDAEAAAEEAFKTSLKLNGSYVDALLGLGNLYLEQGKTGESVALLERVVHVAPENLAARFQLTQIAKVRENDPNLLALESVVKDLESLSIEKRISVHYALGKAYDDLQRYDEAFTHYVNGGRLKRSKLDYSADAEDVRVQGIMDAFTAERFRALQGGGVADSTPVFILGMPRSGTTLTEQIVASHPQVYGAGELPDLLNVIQRPVSGFGEGALYPERLASISHDVLTQWGREYVDRLRGRSQDALRITDKMPVNYMALGIIPLMLPNAKIIHVKRNPLDACLSCFTRLFNRHQEATYDLSELGRHYVNYERLMQHWRRVLPEGSFLEVQYEDVVADIETQARRLIEWVGLEWSDACLSFHKNSRTIRTASLMQVRQPIYTSSVDRWKRYEAHLQPLLEQLNRID